MRVGAWVHTLGGGLGAMLGAIATSPLEVIKTRLQASHFKQQISSSTYFGANTISSVRSLAKQEGVMSLYRGLGTHLSGVIPARSLHFFVYGSVKSSLSEKLPKDSWWIPILSSGAAGATVITFTQPIWLVKTRLQLQTTHAAETLYKSPWDALVKTIQNEGLGALLKGMSASYLGLSETVLQFTIYEAMKNEIHKRREHLPGEKQSLGVFGYIGISCFSKLIASALTYPHEVIRTRLREQKTVPTEMPHYNGAIRGLVVLAREEGVRGLYGGMGAHLMRVVPNAGILFLTYELTLSYFSRHLQIPQ
uniref:Mitochondrial carrier protein n=1 Tax=Arcella intermedia TaxID=1963864 RepID=A0A6B2LAK3_9EUKA